jgi:CheY-like chemotaxis protein
MNKILVIDDSEVNLYLIQTIFDNDHEVQVYIESDSTQALSRIQHEQPDVLVLDLMMPQVDGFQLLQEIKADPGINQIPILIISARLDTEAYNKVKEYGVQGYIKKPIQMRNVEEQIRQLFKVKTK